jgi:hypothetical protein
MRFMQLGRKNSSPLIRSLNLRLDGVREPSLDSSDQENIALLNPIVWLLLGAKTSETAFGVSTNESNNSVFCKKSWTRSRETLPMKLA